MLNSSGTQEGMMFCFYCLFFSNFSSGHFLLVVVLIPGDGDRLLVELLRQEEPARQEKRVAPSVAEELLPSVCPFLFLNASPLFSSPLTGGRRSHFTTCMLVAQLHVGR